jgi:hypothetical protein
LQYSLALASAFAGATLSSCKSPTNKTGSAYLPRGIKKAAQAKQASNQSTKEGISVRRPVSSRLQMGFPCYHATGYHRGLSLPHRFRQLGLDFPIFHRPSMRPETWGTSFLSCVGRRSQRSLGERSPRAERGPLPVFFIFFCLCLLPVFASLSLCLLSRNSREHVVQGRQCRSPALPVLHNPSPRVSKEGNPRNYLPQTPFRPRSKVQAPHGNSTSCL